MISESRIGWLAGIIDGEGCISISSWRCNRSGKIRTTPVVVVSNTNAALLAEVMSIFDEMDVRGRMYRFSRNHGIGEKPRWDVRVAARPSIVTLLRTVRHALVAKRPQCDLMLRFLENWKALDFALLDEMRLLNQRGVDETTTRISDFAIYHDDRRQPLLEMFGGNHHGGVSA